jgi:hypothetical protein
MADASPADLDARLRALEDVRAINDVLFDFHDGASGGFNGKQAHRPEALDSLSDDALIAEAPDRPGFGPKGREAVARHWAYFHGDAGPIPYVLHASVAERVVLDGDAATQVSNMFGIFQLRGAPPVLGLSQRNHAFRRTKDGWRMTYRDSAGGFAVAADALHGPLNALPPQKPRTPWTPED